MTVTLIIDEKYLPIEVFLFDTKITKGRVGPRTLVKLTETRTKVEWNPDSTYEVTIPKTKLTLETKRTVVLADQDEYEIAPNDNPYYESSEIERMNKEGMTVGELVSFLNKLPQDARVTRNIYGTSAPLKPENIIPVNNYFIHKVGEVDQTVKWTHLHNYKGWTIGDVVKTYHITHLNKGN